MSQLEITDLLTKEITIFENIYQEWKLYIIDNQWIELKIDINEGLLNKLNILTKYRFPYTLIQKIGQNGINDETFLNTLQRLNFENCLKTIDNKIYCPSYIYPLLRTISVSL